MPRYKVRLISRGMRDLLHDKGVAADLDRRAERVADAARRSALVETGAYRDSIHVESDVTDRVVARVVTDAPHGPLIESRTGNLSRALDAARGS